MNTENRKQEIKGDKLYTLLDNVHELVYLTSGQCLIFDKDGKQIPELQSKLCKPKHGNIGLLKKVANSSKKFTIGKFREWMQEISKEDFFVLTNLYTA